MAALPEEITIKTMLCLLEIKIFTDTHRNCQETVGFQSKQGRKVLIFSETLTLTPGHCHRYTMQPAFRLRRLTHVHYFCTNLKIGNQYR